MTELRTLIVAAAALLVLAGCGQKPAEQVAADAKASAAAATDAAVSEADLSVLLAQADLQQGERAFIQCRACHSLETGGMNKVGPNLYGVFDQPAGQVEGFNYSEALLGAGLVWDTATMDAWLTRPSDLVPGNRMVFVGIRDPQQRANLIAYLLQETQ
jgi:cytochrome c